MFMEFLRELEKAARYTVACTFGMFGFAIGLPGLILNWASDGLVDLANWFVKKYAKDESTDKIIG